MEQFLNWLMILNAMVEELKILAKNEHEPYDNFGGDNMEIIEIAVQKEIDRLKEINRH